MFDWLFQRKAASPRLRDLEERLEAVERGLKNLRLEADDLYDKTRRAMHRALKRGDAQEEAQEAPGADDPTIRHLDPVSKAIVLRRRSRTHPANGKGV